VNVGAPGSKLSATKLGVNGLTRLIYQPPMRRSSTKSPVPVTMYRHFAAITLVLTTLLAIFSSGERSQAVAEQFKSRQQMNALKQAERRKLGSHAVGSGKFNIGKGRTIDTSEPEPDSSEQGPPSSDRIAWSGPAALAPQADGMGLALSPDARAISSKNPGLSSLGAADSDAKSSRLLKPKPPHQPTKHEMERMLAGSRNRSGSGDQSQVIGDLNDSDEAGDSSGTWQP